MITVLLYCTGLQSYCVVQDDSLILYCTGLQSYCIVQDYSPTVLYRITVLRYCTGLLSYAIVQDYSPTLLYRITVLLVGRVYFDTVALAIVATSIWRYFGEINRILFHDVHEKGEICLINQRIQRYNASTALNDGHQNV